MTSTHTSKKYLDGLPSELKARYIPQATQPERFVRGKPVKGRNEPCTIGGVAWVVHKAMGLASFEELTQHAWDNTVRVFKLHDLE
jgi:TatD DNase family protein